MQKVHFAQLALLAPYLVHGAESANSLIGIALAPMYWLALDLFMNNIISFGKYEGKTFEWLFFNDPSYAKWMYKNRVHRQQHNFDEEQGDEFAELFRRARQLRTPCRLCQVRQATRMGMTFHEISAASNSIGFYCDECEHVGNGPIIYNSPSFFSDFTVSPHEQATMIRCIKNVFIGSHVPLTQRKMEEFFHNDAHFVQATQGFFAKEAAAV